MRPARPRRPRPRSRDRPASVTGPSQSKFVCLLVGRRCKPGTASASAFGAECSEAAAQPLLRPVGVFACSPSPPSHRLSRRRPTAFPVSQLRFAMLEAGCVATHSTANVRLLGRRRGSQRIRHTTHPRRARPVFASPCLSAHLLFHTCSNRSSRRIFSVRWLVAMGTSDPTQARHPFFPFPPFIPFPSPPSPVWCKQIWASARSRTGSSAGGFRSEPTTTTPATGSQAAGTGCCSASRTGRCGSSSSPSPPPVRSPSRIKHLFGSIFVLNLFRRSTPLRPTASTILSGAVAGRMKLKVYCAMSFVVTAFIYPPMAHMAWDSRGWLKRMGYFDFAGDGPVHLLGGTLGVVSTWLLGPRISVFSKSGQYFPHRSSPSSAILGTFILWWGWYVHEGGVGSSRNARRCISLIPLIPLILPSSSRTGSRSTPDPPRPRRSSRTSRRVKLRQTRRLRAASRSPSACSCRTIGAGTSSWTSTT